MYSSPYPLNISFVPHDDYTGSVVMSFTGYGKDGTGYGGKLVVLVVDSPRRHRIHMRRRPAKPSGSRGRLRRRIYHRHGLGALLCAVSRCRPRTRAPCTPTTLRTTGRQRLCPRPRNTTTLRPRHFDIVFGPAGRLHRRCGDGIHRLYGGRASFAGKLKFRFGAAETDGGEGTELNMTNINVPVTFDTDDFSRGRCRRYGVIFVLCHIFALPMPPSGRLLPLFGRFPSIPRMVTATTKYYGSTPLLSDSRCTGYRFCRPCDTCHTPAHDRR